MDLVWKKLKTLISAAEQDAAGILVITTILPAEAQSLLDEFKRSANPKLEIRQWTHIKRPSKDELHKLVNGACCILLTLREVVDEEFLDAVGPSLKAISVYGTGYDHIDVDLIRRRGISLGNTPGAVT
ncbi:Glyoxylate reductase/hydroxypyruvate reductase, partial [Smittium mucronatum]